MKQTFQNPRRIANRNGVLFLVAFLVVVLHDSNAASQTNDVLVDPSELKRMSLEELFNMEVTSVSRKSERLSEAAAAIHVVTGEDIRRSGALSIPEALRNIPGVEVARVDSRQYAITARGFNGTVANKLLVLMDGRSIYTPLFSGVFWDAQDTFMEDLERIEVIRGPGATVWGANAVNGVINIITKSAEETQGLLVTGGGGNEEQGFGGVRYGGQQGSNVFFRVYGKYFNRADSVLPNGSDAGDRYRMGQGGFRLDLKADANSVFTLQSDIYDGEIDQPAPGDVTISGGNYLGRWTHAFSDESDLQIRAYYDRTKRDIPGTFGETLDTFDVELRHRFPLGEKNDIVWGTGYRVTDDRVRNSAVLAFLPADLTHHLITGFVQDEIEIVENRLQMTLGSKIEHNDYTGFEFQPSGRIGWFPSERHTFWGAASRAVRTPSRIDRELYSPSTPPYLLAGGPDFDSEKVYAFELGYKVRPGTRIEGNLATFYNIYDDLRSLEAGPPQFLGNGLEGESYGVEIGGSGQVYDWWRIRAGYTFFRLLLDAKPGSTDTSQQRQEGDSPRNQFFITSRMDLPHQVELDATTRYVDSLSNQSVPAYWTLDVHVGWKPLKNLELAVVGKNLLDSQHAEFGGPASRREVERSVYGKITWQF